MRDPPWGRPDRRYDAAFQRWADYFRLRRPAYDADFRRDPGGAFGYRGPGTDLGEDIRRGYVRREGPRGPLAPHPERYDRPFHRYDGDFRGGDWGRPLREGWSGLRRRPRR